MTMVLAALLSHHHTGMIINLKHCYARIVIACFVSLMLASAPAQAVEPPFAVKAEQVLLVDDQTGTILFSKAPDLRFAPASLAKLMTIEVVFHALQTGTIQLAQSFKVSEHAWRTGGAPSGTATMFAKIHSELTVNDLIQGVIVQAANDGAIVLAEGIAGSEEAFARLMNERALIIGLQNSNFMNPTGLPAPAGAEQQNDQYVNLSDLVLLAQHIQKTYPDYYSIYAQDSFEWNKIFQRNRNPLLRLDIGAEGLVMGGTKQSGFSIIASAKQNNRRIFLGLGGAATAADRADEAEKLLRWAMNEFVEKQIFSGGNEIGQASLFGGEQGSVALIVKDPVKVLLLKNPRENTQEIDRLRAQIIYTGPVLAPVEAGQEIGHLQILRDREVLLEKPVYAANAVGQGGLHRRAMDAVIELTTGWLRQYW